jgi:phosphoglycolate phosphatase-like HAD superfamily hydrolase
MQTPVAAVVLDLDGVIVKSNFAKYQTMLSLFAEYRNHYAEISAYILANIGARRDIKIRHILENIVGSREGEEAVASYLSRYADALERVLAEVPLVEGVAQFIANSKYTFYVSSSSPESEVHEQLARHKLDMYFADVYGQETRKEEALRQIAARHSGAAVVFFGDSASDLAAALEADVSFVAVINEHDSFAGVQVEKLVDFTSMAAVEMHMQKAF